MSRSLTKPEWRRMILIKLNLCMALLWIFCQGLYAQINVLNSTGRSASIQENTFSWSAGEMVLTQTFKQTEIILTQGFLQNTLQTLVANNDETKSTRIKIYPNPFTEQFNIELDSPISSSWRVDVKDILGRPVLLFKGTSARKFIQSIQLPDNGTGVYQLSIRSMDKRNPIQFSQWILKL